VRPIHFEIWGHILVAMEMTKSITEHGSDINGNGRLVLKTGVGMMTN
jgi:hypothetical protein